MMLQPSHHIFFMSNSTRIQITTLAQVFLHTTVTHMVALLSVPKVVKSPLHFTHITIHSWLTHIGRFTFDITILSIMNSKSSQLKVIFHADSTTCDYMMVKIHLRVLLEHFVDTMVLHLEPHQARDNHAYTKDSRTVQSADQGPKTKLSLHQTTH